MGLADISALREKTVEVNLARDALSLIEATLDDLSAAAIAELVEQGAAADQIEVLRSVYLKYAGTDAAFAVDFGTTDNMRLNFESAYRNRYGFSKSEKELIVEIVAVEAIDGPDITDSGAIGGHVASGRIPRNVRRGRLGFSKKSMRLQSSSQRIWSPVIPFLVPRL